MFAEVVKTFCFVMRTNCSFPHEILINELETSLSVFELLTPVWKLQGGGEAAEAAERCAAHLLTLAEMMLLTGMLFGPEAG